MIENAIVELLEQDAQLAELVGTRIYPGEADVDATLPYVTYSIVGEEREAVGNLVEASLDLDCYARTLSVANQIADRLRVLLHKAQTVAAGVPIRGAFLRNRTHTVLPPEDGSGRGKHLVACEFDVWYQE